MTNYHRVSVIIPTFNAAHLVGEAIESVLNQSLTDLELIVVDDGSEDNTEEFVRARYPDIKYIQKPNTGPGSARNVGIRASRGEFIAFLDADDIWLPEKLALQVALMDRNPDLGMVFANRRIIDASGTVGPASSKEGLLVGDVVRNIFLYSGVATPTVMVRRSVLDGTGLFEEGLPAAEDDNLWIRIAFRWPIDIVKEPLVLVRSRPDSLSKEPGKFFEGVMAHIEILENRYPDIYNRLGSRAIRSKLSTVYRIEGYAHFGDERMGEARRGFVKSLLSGPRLITVGYLLASLLPLRLIRWLRRIKQSWEARSNRGTTFC